MSSSSTSSSTLLFVVVGRNEPLFEAEFNTSAKQHRSGGGTASSSNNNNNNNSASESASRQNYFVLHSALDLVERAAWTSPQMYLKVVDKVRTFGSVGLYEVFVCVWSVYLIVLSQWSCIFS